jgi:LysR family transcriptional regulator, transcriptional activator for dmlA
MHFLEIIKQLIISKNEAMNTEDLELVLAVHQQGSMVGAARALRSSAPMVTKRLAALEARLGLRLFQRSTRKVAATAEGALLCERAAPLLAQHAALAEDLLAQRQELRGPIKLASSLGFGRRWLGPVLAQFAKAQPLVDVQLVLHEALPDLAAQGFDGAVWLWAAQANRVGEWTSRKLASNRRVLVAAPSYLKRHSAPQTLANLAQHQCLRVNEHVHAQDLWALSDLQAARGKLKSESANALHTVRIKGQLCTNSGELALDWCLAGHGIMLRSSWDAAPHIAAGRLVHVLPRYAMLDADVHWLAPFRNPQPKRVSALVAHLVKSFKDSPWIV